MTKNPHRRGLFIAESLTIIIVFFGVAALLEKTMFSNAPLHMLKYFYAIRGAGASLLVMGLAILFIMEQHRRSEAELKKLSQAVEQSPATIVITDRNGTIEYVNPRFTKITGYTPEEVLGKNPRILKSGRTPPDEYKSLWETIASGKDWQGELVNRKKNGELYDESLSISPIRDRRGGIAHFVAVLEDITERKKIEQFKDELVGNVSHEIRTPLAVIRWSVENLRDGLAGPLQPEQREIVEGIRKNCERLTKISNDVLDFSRLEAVHARLNLQKLDLPSLIQEVVRDFQEPYSRQGLSLRTKIADDLPTVYADSDMILQVLDNLLDNAGRFAHHEVAVSADKQDDGCLRVSIDDDGAGIEPKEIGGLFSRFRQATRPHGGTGYKGTGLGLAICKDIVERHRGHIWAESTAGRGGRIHFSLPTQSSESNEGGVYEKDSHH